MLIFHMEMVMELIHFRIYIFGIGRNLIQDGREDIMEYIEIKYDSDIEKLMEEFGWFHDSCIKELKYYSGGYVDEDGDMYPFNSKRCVKIIFQSQNAHIRVIEMKFEKIQKLNLRPRYEEYDCIIYNASLKKINNLFYWSEWENFKEEDLKKEDGTWISAQKVSWRPLNNTFGDKEIYRMIE